MLVLLHIKKRGKKEPTNSIHYFRNPYTRYLFVRWSAVSNRLKKFRVTDFNFLEIVEFLGADKNIGLNTTLWKA